MMMRVMMATALALGLGAAALATWPEGDVERVASRAEVLAEHPRLVPASLADCAPARVLETHI